MHEDNELYDITIVGGGPCGLYAAYYAGLRRMKVKVIDIQPQLGGQLAALYPEKGIHDVAGFPSVLARELVDNLVKQAVQYPCTICLGEKVIELKAVERGVFRLGSDRGRHVSRSAMIAAGVGAFIPRKLDIPSIDELQGKGVHYYPRDVRKFMGRRVAVIGGGDSALDLALAMEKVAAKVILIHRLNRFQAHEDSVDRLFNSGIEVRFPYYELQAIHGEERLEGITCFNSESRLEVREEIDDLVICAGFLTNLGPIKEWGLELEGNGIKVGPRMNTNLAGVYACGDIVSYPGKIKLISTGMGEAAIGVSSAKEYLDGDVDVGRERRAGF